MKFLPSFTGSHSVASLSAALALSFIGGAALSLQADDLYIWVEEVGGDVIFHHQGSIDLMGLSKTTTVSLSPTMNPGNGNYRGASGLSDIYTDFVPDGDERMFGTDTSTSASSASGSLFTVDLDTNLGVPAGYTSGSPIDGTMPFLSTDLATLGVDTMPFSYDTTVGTNTIHMFTMPPPVVTDNSAAKAELLKQIQKLKKKAKKLKKKGKKAKAKKLGKKVKKLQAQLAALG